MNKLLYTENEWNFELLNTTWQAIDYIGSKQLGLDYYDPQIEIISSSQMLENYSSHAMPVMYDHWSFGKSFIQNETSYKKGQSGLAYEVVINTDPSIAYLMENNTMTMQTLVMAHAICGHGSFFKNNYLFKDWSDADSIIDYLKFAKKYINECEIKYGHSEVEELLDACHSLQIHGIDKYKKPIIKREIERQKEINRNLHIENTFNDIWRTLPLSSGPEFNVEEKDRRVPEENLLYFLEKYSPILKPWQREIVRIIRKVAQYFYPQRQTAVMNEGWACIIHYTIMTMLHDQGKISEGNYLEFLSSHSGVIYQPNWDSRNYSGLNVYALGFAIMMDIKRICQNPDKEDKYYFPDICNTNWVETLKHIVANYRDESFLLQFISPKIIKKFKLFSIETEQLDRFWSIKHTHDEEHLLNIRHILSSQYDLSKRIPHIEIMAVDWEGDRSIFLNHYVMDNIVLAHDDARRTAEYFHILWGHPVRINYIGPNGEDI